MLVNGEDTATLGKPLKNTPAFVFLDNFIVMEFVDKHGQTMTHEPYIRQFPLQTSSYSRCHKTKPSSLGTWWDSGYCTTLSNRTPHAEVCTGLDSKPFV